MTLSGFSRAAFVWMFGIRFAGLSFGETVDDWCCIAFTKFEDEPSIGGSDHCIDGDLHAEMLTSLFAAESPGLAMGTIVGSNLANTG